MKSPFNLALPVFTMTLVSACLGAESWGEMTKPARRHDLPKPGNYYSAQQLQRDARIPPVPGAPPGLPVYAVDERTFIYDDLDVDYATWRRAAHGERTAKAAGAEGGGGASLRLEEYGTNLWLEIRPGTNEYVVLLHNTTPGAPYHILSLADLDSRTWRLEQGIIGAEEQDWTATTIPKNGRESLFLVAGSSEDTDGDGLSDAWEHFVTRSDPASRDSLGDGVPDGYRDTDGDGWTALEEMENGTDPHA